MVNRAMLIVTALTIATIFLVASFFPRPLVLPAMSELLIICAIVATVVAIFRRQPFRPGYFTFWDKAVVLLFLSVGAQLLSDPQKVEAYLDAARAGTLTETATITQPITRSDAPSAGLTDAAAPTATPQPDAPQPVR